MQTARRITTLAYHDIVAAGRFELSGFQSPDANIYKLDVEEFRDHLREISRQQYRAVRFDSVVRRKDKVLLLTFDDGGAGAALCTAGVLGELGWPGHFFITTDRIGSPGFLTVAQIRDLHKMGHVIGSHSCSHPLRMSHMSGADLMREWRDSKVRLEDILGEAVETAAVPGGFYNRRVGAAVAAAGVRFLFTSEPVVSVHSVNRCRVMGRFSVAQGTGAKWVGAVVAGRIGPRLRSYLFWNSKKVLKTIGGQVWLDVRRNILARRAL